MAWNLEIHHLDVTSTGDSTLIIAREVPPLIGAAPLIRAALIDGGRRKYANEVHTYIGAQLGVGIPLHVMVSTHYDADHLYGLIGLLTRPVRYNTTRIYDQGWPDGGLDDGYINYLKAINGRNNNGPIPALAGIARRRITNAVLADGVGVNLPISVANLGLPAVPIGGAAAINQAQDWLVGTEILWDGALGGVPAGAPTLTCIAANRVILQPGGGQVGPIGGLGIDPKNEKSLAFVLRFNNFRYYVGGDIETAQEDHIQILLNNANNAVGRVLVMKASHHGAHTATSRAFIDRVRPEAVMISCGTSNSINPPHPAEETINVLDGFAAIAGAHPAIPPPPPNRPIDHYLTGYQDPGIHPFGVGGGQAPQHIGGDNALVAGDPTPPLAPGGALALVIPGHIVVRVSEAQSNVDIRGRLVIGVAAATHAAATTAGAVAAAATAAANAAGEAALSFGAGAAAQAAAISLGMAPAIAAGANAAAIAAISLPGATVTACATAVTTNVLLAGGNAAAAAATGAAAAAAFGGGDGVSISNALIAALGAAGIAAPMAAAAAAAAAALAMPGAPGLFDVGYHDYFAIPNAQNLTIV